MNEVVLLSWNVNGIRAILNKKIWKENNFLQWLKVTSPDVLCIQETKANPEQLTNELLNPMGYYGYWNSAEQKGYSGVATFCKEKPQSVNYNLGEKEFDTEGRLVITEHSHFYLLNVYFPNGKQSDERLKYKMNYYDLFLKTIENLRKKGKSIVFCGDINTAHKPIDLARPKENETISGFLPTEREWIDKVISIGYVDSFRHIHKDKPYQYTWWSVRTGSRNTNVGWRLDYFFMYKDILTNVLDAYILSDVLGSDHCPIGLKLKF